MDIIATDDLILNKWVSRLDGRRFSLKINFVPSARIWRILKGPAYLGLEPVLEPEAPLGEELPGVASLAPQLADLELTAEEFIP